MKQKYFILTIILATFLSASVSYGEVKFGVSLTGGYSSIDNSDFNDSVDGTVNFYKDIYDANSLESYEVSFEKITGTLNGDMEIRIIPVESFMIGLGVGYMSFPVSTFVNKYNDTIAGSIDYEQEISTKVIPLSFSAYYVIGAGKNLNLNIGAGVEYYMGSTSIKNTKNERNGTALTLEDTADYSGSGIGVSLKLGGELKVSSNFSFLGGIIGRFGKVSGFEGDVKQADGTTKKEKLYSYDLSANNKTYHLFASDTEEEKSNAEKDSTISNLEEASVILSGVSIYLGIGLTF